MKEHRAWSQRIQSLVVDGSPKWEVYRSVEVEVDQQQPVVQRPVAAPVPAVRAPSSSFALPSRLSDADDFILKVGCGVWDVGCGMWSFDRGNQYWRWRW